MTEPSVGGGIHKTDDRQVSFFDLACALLRWRRTISVLGLVGGALGLLLGLMSARVYVSNATFIPQGSEAAASGGVLAAAASQFGIGMPSSGPAWGPSVYVELLNSQALLEPVALDTVAVAEEGGRRAAIMDLLKVKAPTTARRTYLAVLALSKIVTASEDKKIGAVKLSVKTRWPSVSLALAEHLIRGVNQFNLATRKSQASAERQFAEVQAGEAESALRNAEDGLQQFLQRNRAIEDSPELRFARDRLQREVALRQQVYTSLLQSREEARIREVRDTPVLTMLEDPRLPVIGEARRSLQKGVLGVFLGAIIGMLVASLAQGIAEAQRNPTEAGRQFFEAYKEAMPQFLRRRMSR